MYTTSLLIALICVILHGIMSTKMFTDIEILSKYSSITLCEPGWRALKKHPVKCFSLIPERAGWIGAIGICHFKYSASAIQHPLEFHENEIHKQLGVDSTRFNGSHILGWWAGYSATYLKNLIQEDKLPFSDPFNVDVEGLEFNLNSQNAIKSKSYKNKFSCKIATGDIVEQPDGFSWIEAVRACFRIGGVLTTTRKQHSWTSCFSHTENNTAATKFALKIIQVRQLEDPDSLARLSSRSRAAFGGRNGERASWILRVQQDAGNIEETQSDDEAEKARHVICEKAGSSVSGEMHISHFDGINNEISYLIDCRVEQPERISMNVTVSVQLDKSLEVLDIRVLGHDRDVREHFEEWRYYIQVKLGVQVRAACLFKSPDNSSAAAIIGPQCTHWECLNINFNFIETVYNVTYSKINISDIRDAQLTGSAVPISSEIREVRAGRFNCELIGELAALEKLIISLELDKNVENKTMSIVFEIDKPSRSRWIWRWDIAGLPRRPVPASCVAKNRENSTISVRFQLESQPQTVTDGTPSFTASQTQPGTSTFKPDISPYLFITLSFLICILFLVGWSLFCSRTRRVIEDILRSWGWLRHKNIDISIRDIEDNPALIENADFIIDIDEAHDMPDTAALEDTPNPHPTAPLEPTSRLLGDPVPPPPRGLPGGSSSQSHVDLVPAAPPAPIAAGLKRSVSDCCGLRGPTSYHMSNSLPPAHDTQLLRHPPLLRSRSLFEVGRWGWRSQS